MKNFNLSPDAATGTTTAKRTMSYDDWFHLAYGFYQELKYSIKGKFMAYVNKIRVSTDRFDPNKLESIEAFDWKYDYEYAWSVFLKEYDEDLLADGMRFYKTDTHLFIDDNIILGRYLKQFACEAGVKIAYYTDDKRELSKYSVFIVGKSKFFIGDVASVSNTICHYVLNYRDKMRRDEVEWTDTIHISKDELSERDFRMLVENKEYAELVEWRCMDDQSWTMIDGIKITSTGIDVFIDC